MCFFAEKCQPFKVHSYERNLSGCRFHERCHFFMNEMIIWMGKYQTKTNFICSSFVCVFFFSSLVCLCRALEHVIRQFIESKVQRNSSRHTVDYAEPVIHDMAFYPLCKWISICFDATQKENNKCHYLSYRFQSVGSKNNQTSWLEENTAKLYFSSSIFEKLVPNTYLQRAILRYLFQWQCN